MKSNKVILPINTNPYLKSYTHNTYISGILSSESVSGEIVVRYKVLNKKNTWKVINHNCKTQIDEDIVVCAQGQYENGYSVIYNKCEDNDVLIIKINFRRKICAWEQVCLILDDEISEESFDLNKCLVKFGCPSGERMNVKRKENFVAINNCKRILEQEYYLKLERKGLNLKYSYSHNGRRWQCVYSEVLPVKYQIAPLSIGVLVEARNHYMNWLAGNYIQLYMKKPYKDEIMIDYYAGYTKHYKTYVSNHYLNFMFEYFDYNRLSCKKMEEIIFARLNEDYYVIMELNHYYIPKTACYQKKSFYHEVMIYGINKKKGVYYVMGYGEQNVVYTYELKFRELWLALNPLDIRLIIGRVDVNSNGYDINTDMIKKRLVDYINGNNNERDISDIMPQQETMAYGLDIFRQLISREDDLYIFCTDIRLSYVFYEHKKIMLDRVRYLFNNIIVSEADSARIISLLEKNIRIAQIIKNSILISIVGDKKKSSMKKIRGYLEEVVKNEEIAYVLLCKVL